MKTIRYTLTIVVLLTMVLAISAQDTGDDDAPTVAEQIELVERNTEILRGLVPKQDVPVMFPSREETRGFITSEFVEFYTSQRLEELMAFYVAFDFLPADFDIQAAVLELYSQQVIGYYDPDTQTMNLVTNDGQAPQGRILLLDRITYSHEYVHALQDQYFDLAAYQEEMETNPNLDSNLAFQALIEGDASFVMNEYARQVTESNPLGAAFQLGLGALQTDSLFLPPGTPDIFEAELFFPYLEGERFVRALFADGGWDTVNAAYASPPQSTELVLHPEKYLLGERPHLVELEANAPAGWTVALSGTMGEFYLREWLDTQFTSNEPINLAATGWGGDTFHIYRSASNDFAWELRLSWDTPQDADEFGTAIQDFIALRLPESTRSVGEVSCWEAAAAMCVRMVDATQTDVTFASTLEIAMELLN